MPDEDIRIHTTKGRLQKRLPAIPNIMNCQMASFPVSPNNPPPIGIMQVNIPGILRNLNCMKLKSISGLVIVIRLSKLVRNSTKKTKLPKLIKTVNKSSCNSNTQSKLNSFRTNGTMSPTNEPTIIEPKISFNIRPGARYQNLI